VPPGEDIRIDPVRLRQLPRRLRKVAHWPRVHDDHGQRRRRERRGAEEFITAGRVEHDELRADRAQSVNEGPDATFIVCDREALSHREHTDDQLGLRNVDPNEHAPPLQRRERISRRPSL
jgi:hypothetical protein